ncbi:hypothetical protein CCAX7_18420 [Capsulimonas corticalis]|uniref:Uncharacterized protein n=1 Tax=Capsulimonas corticalis TaxID=2219043 RepID=A0A402D5P0_9BACT|nr:vWA domain-containing protein [Capsulimonas corticalis]BDI29791.1 hypothetical protein CCAX7_18420 [Capsulimonas corticalis]
MTSRTKLNIALFAALCALPIAACAQDAPSQASLPQFAAQIKAIHPKTVVFVFDVSGSTRHGGVFGRERAATATLLRQGCDPGDHVILKSFGTGTQTVFDKTITDAADAAALTDQIPSAVTPGAGTNIREPHHEALKAIEQDLPNPGVVVLLTDSFNDRPLESDPNYPAYLNYYTLKGLTVYPSSSENRDYERLLRTLKSSDKLTEYGVGVGIATSGRPIERLPVGPGQDDNAGDDQSTAPTTLTPSTPEKPQSNLPAIIGGAVALLAILAFAAMSALRRPQPLRLKLGDKGRPVDFQLRPGSRVQLGGSIGAGGPGDETFPLAGVAAPAAAIEAKGGLTLIPAVKGSDTVKVYHNGARLEGPTAVRTGDEIRLVTAATETSPEREHRVRVADPKEASF